MFIEVDAWFNKSVDPEIEQNNISIFGENREHWPDGEWFELKPLLLNVIHITSANPSSKKDQTTVRTVNDTEGYAINMNYTDFKKLTNYAVREPR